MFHQVINRQGKTADVGLEKGKIFGRQAANPYPIFPEVLLPRSSQWPVPAWRYGHFSNGEDHRPFLFSLAFAQCLFPYLLLKGTSTPIKESLWIGGYNICNNASFNFFFRRVSIVEKNEFQNPVFLFSDFLGAAILNNCDVKWLSFCFKTKALCLITKGQKWRFPLIRDKETNTERL